MKMTMDQITAAHPNVAKLESQAGRELLAEMMDQMQALAVENAGLKSKGRELLGEACAVYAKLNKLIDPTIGDFVDGQTLHEFQFVLDVETPATDRFFAETKAQGVEEFLRGSQLPYQIATVLADYDNVDDATLQTVIWSGQPPEPDGDVWHLEYVSRGNAIVRAALNQLREAK